MGYEAYRERVFERQKAMGLVPDGRGALADQPVRRRRRATTASRGPELDSVRPWDSLSDDEKRLFARMAEVYAGFLSHADHELGRLLDHLEESGRARQHDHRARLRQRRLRRGRPERLGEREQVLQRHPRHDRGEPQAPRRAGRHEDLQPLPDRLGLGVQHAVQDVEALLELRGRHGRPVDRLLAARASRPAARSAASTPTPSTSCRRSTSASASSLPEVVNGYTQTPLEGVSFARQLRRRGREDRQADAVLLDARDPGDLAPGLEGGHRRAGGARSRGATSTSSAGSSSTPTTDPSECHDLAAEHPDKLQELIALWWAEAGAYQALPLESRGADRDPGHRAPAAVQAAQPVRLLPRRRGDTRVGRPEHPQPLLHDRRRVEIDTPEAGGVIFSQGSRFGGHALYVKDGKLQVRLQLGRRAHPDRRVRRADPDRPRRPVRLVRAGGRRDARPRAR